MSSPLGFGLGNLAGNECPVVCRFSDAGNGEAGYRLGDRRRKSAEADLRLRSWDN